jgi:hypothetical protein
MISRLLTFLFALLLTTANSWAGSGTITVKDASGVTQTFVVTTNGGGDYVNQHTICDGTAAAQCAAVKAASTAAAATDPALVVAVSPNNILSIAANTTPSIANGNGIVPSTSAETGAATSTGATTVLASNLVVKASAGNLYSFNVSADSTLSGAAWWIMIFNSTTLPSDGTVTPAKCYAMPSGVTSYSAAFNLPVAFSTGIVIGVSTTGCFTKTASVHAFVSGDYK